MHSKLLSRYRIIPMLWRRLAVYGCTSESYGRDRCIFIDSAHYRVDLHWSFWAAKLRDSLILFKEISLNLTFWENIFYIYWILSSNEPEMRDSLNAQVSQNNAWAWHSKTQSCLFVGVCLNSSMTKLEPRKLDMNLYRRLLNQEATGDKITAFLCFDASVSELSYMYFKIVKAESSSVLMPKETCLSFWYPYWPVMLPLKLDLDDLIN